MFGNQGNSSKVAIIILNWNGYQDTAECLQSLRKINYPNYEIVVVDNGSVDGSPDRLKKEFPYITLIRNRKNLGFAEGNNVGIKYALSKGVDYILFLNNDTVVDPDFLTVLVKVAENEPGVAAVAPIIYYYDQPQKIWFAGGGIDWRIGQPYHFTREGESGKNIESDFLTGCAILTKKKVLEEVGMFDPLFFLDFEETDWCMRVKAAGYKLLCVPKSKIWHKISRAMGGFNSPSNVYYFTRNQMLFLKKHKKRIPFLLYVKDILKFVGFASFALFRPANWQKAVSVVRGMIDYRLGRFGQGFSDKM